MITVKEKYSREDLERLDRKVEFIPLTYDYIFKGAFGRNKEIFKDFLLLVLKIDIEKEYVTINLLDKELIKDNYLEYKKTVDFNILINDNIKIDLEVNRKYFEEVEFRNFMYLDKINISQLETGENINKLNNIYVIQLNINAKEKNINYGEDWVYYIGTKTNRIYSKNKFMVLKYIEYYRRLYYNNNGNCEKDEIWLASLAARSFVELDEILSYVLSIDDKNKFLESVIKMNQDEFILHEWQKDKFDAYENKKMKDDAYEKGQFYGIEEEKINTIKNMLDNKIDYSVISKVTGKSIEEIEKIDKSMKD